MVSRKVIFLLLLLTTVVGLGQVHAEGKRRKNALKATKELMKYQEYQNAITYIEELLQSDGQNAYYNFWMGKCLYLTYKKNQALPYLEKVEKVNPDVDAEFHYYYAPHTSITIFNSTRLSRSTARTWSATPLTPRNSAKSTTASASVSTPRRLH